MKTLSLALLSELLTFILFVSNQALAGAQFRVVDIPSANDPSEVSSVAEAIVRACRIPIENPGDRHIILMDKLGIDVIKKDFAVSINCPIELKKGQGLGEIHFAARSAEGISSLMINAPFVVRGLTFRALYSDLLVQFGSIAGEPPLAWLTMRSEFEDILLEGRNLTTLVAQNYRYPLIVKNLRPQIGERKGVWLSVLNNQSEFVMDGGRIGGVVAEHQQGESVISYSTSVRLVDVQILGNLDIQSSQIVLRSPVITGQINISSISSESLPFPLPGLPTSIQARVHLDRPIFKHFLGQSGYEPSILSVEGNAKVKLESPIFEAAANGNSDFLIVDNSEIGGGIVSDPLAGAIGLTPKNVSSSVDYNHDDCADYPVPDEPSAECETVGHAPPVW